MPANFVLWQLQGPAELAYWFGQRPACRVVRQRHIVEEQTMSSAAQALFAPHALLPRGWAQDVLLPWDGTGRLAG